MHAKTFWKTDIWKTEKEMVRLLKRNESKRDKISRILLNKKFQYLYRYLALRGQ
jgi:hypothetical protein